jgi:hypothetical protein
MPPTEHRFGNVECGAMLLKIGPLDEVGFILLLNRNEHPQYIAEQMAAAFGNTVKKNRLTQGFLRELPVLFIQRVSVNPDFRHRLFLALGHSKKKTGDMLPCRPSKSNR